MDDFPVPAQEASRLRVLDSIGAMNTPPDAFTDAVAKAAAGIVGTPMSAVTLIGEQSQWVKSTCNLPTGAVPRGLAFCSHTVLSRQPMVIPDTLLDVRFSAHPAVVGPPYVRFYAGFPLVVAQRAVGALCVVDDRPRVLSPEQTERLTRLAEGTAAWLALQHPDAA